jgi:hypothetical protein
MFRTEHGMWSSEHDMFNFAQTLDKTCPELRMVCSSKNMPCLRFRCKWTWHVVKCGLRWFTLRRICRKVNLDRRKNRKPGSLSSHTMSQITSYHAHFKTCYVLLAPTMRYRAFSAPLLRLELRLAAAPKAGGEGQREATAPHSAHTTYNSAQAKDRRSRSAGARAGGGKKEEKRRVTSPRCLTGRSSCKGHGKVG